MFVIRVNLFKFNYEPRTTSENDFYSFHRFNQNKHSDLNYHQFHDYMYTFIAYVCRNFGVEFKGKLDITTDIRHRPLETALIKL